jgi:hypothetical protein
MKNFGVGLIILLGVVLGYLFLGASDTDFITGGVSFVCHSGYKGIYCGDYVYKLADGGCNRGEVKICTNYCSVERVLTGKDLVCPEFCYDYCIPTLIANKLNR